MSLRRPLYVMDTFKDTFGTLWMSQRRLQYVMNISKTYFVYVMDVSKTTQDRHISCVPGPVNYVWDFSALLVLCLLYTLEMSFVRFGCLKNVSETVNVHWEPFY